VFKAMALRRIKVSNTETVYSRIMVIPKFQFTSDRRFFSSDEKANAPSNDYQPPLHNVPLPKNMQKFTLSSDEELQPHWRAMEARINNRQLSTNKAKKGRIGVRLTGIISISFK
jgi:hypothetical protein